MEQLKNYRNKEFQRIHSKFYFGLVESGYGLCHSIPELFDMAYAMALRKIKEDELKLQNLQKTASKNLKFLIFLNPVC